MRTINEQLKDLIAGTKTISEIIQEGVHSYAIEYYSPQAVESQKFSELQNEWRKTQKPNELRKMVFDEKLVECSCGHTVRSILVMGSSKGSSCPDCYDKMSE